MRLRVKGIKEEGQDESESEIRDYIIVDIK